MMTNLVVSGLVPAGYALNGELVFHKGDREVVVRGGAVVVLQDFDKKPEKTFVHRFRRKVRTFRPTVEIDRTSGLFDREKATAAAEETRRIAMANPDTSGYGKKTNVGAGTQKGPGGSRSKMTTNPKKLAKLVRKNAQRRGKRR